MNEREILFNPQEASVDKRLQTLKQLYPECFAKDGAFLSEKFMQEVKTQDVDIQKEYYSLNWLGKSYGKVLRDIDPSTLLAEDLEHNQKAPNKDSQNLLIKGDNLEVLKHLQNAYKNKVKMIYIDPPYNTGSDGFVYQDERQFTVEQLAELAGIDLEEAQRILDFTAKKSNSHSAWLTFMYPRLYIARELLKDDGVIFISIDDNEQAQLKLLCDEVFGEENFIDIFSWQKTTTPPNLSKKTKKTCEYILVYQKNEDVSLTGVIKENKSSNGLMNQSNLVSDLVFPAFKTKTKLKDGIYLSGAYGTKSYEIELLTDTKVKNGIFVSPVHLRGKFKWSQSYLDEQIKSGTDLFIQTKAFSPSYEKQKYELEKTWNLLNKDCGVGTNENASKELDGLFYQNFSDNLYPKPISLISYLINTNMNKSDLILDFFAGSGTTAHAVMQLNAEDGGNRRFILVQIPEKIDEKSNAYGGGYKTIFDITKARLEKASAKIQSDNPDYQGDLGFKIFATVDDFRNLPDYENELNNKQMSFDFTQNVLTQEQVHILLTTWRVYDGQVLPNAIKQVDLAGYSAYLCGKQLYLLHDNFNHLHIKAILEKLDNDKDFVLERIILHGDSIESAKQQELRQAIKSYNNKKSLEINVLARY